MTFEKNSPVSAELMERLERAEQNQHLLAQDLRQSKIDMVRATRRSRRQGVLALAAIIGMGVITFRPDALAQTPGVTLASLQAAISALQQKTAALTQTGTPGAAGAKLTVTGVNLQIVNGLGSTNGTPSAPTSQLNTVVNGLGNLIIGYDALGSDNGDIRTGSHNLILGDVNDYSSYGGIVAGVRNTVSGPYGVVSGGANNTASGIFASVSGGFRNTAKGNGSSVTGGVYNIAGGEESTISGGSSNTAMGSGSSVGGGVGNAANGQYSSIGGGGLFSYTTFGFVGITQNTQYGWAAGGTGSGDFHSP